MVDNKMFYENLCNKRHTEQRELFGNESAEVYISSYQNN